MLERFPKRSRGRATGIGYALEGKYNRKLLAALSGEDVFYESFLIFYGFPRQKIYTKLSTFYTNTPYDRGTVFLYGSTVAQTPVVLFVNLESRCVDKNDIEKAIEIISEGYHSLYISIPFTNNELTTLYRESVYRILRELGLGKDLVYPSYTLVVGKNRLFRDAPSSLWSSEVLAALMTEVVVGRDRIMVKNSNCIDQMPKGIKGFGRIYIGKLIRDVLYMLESRKVIDVEQKKRYINELVTT